MQAIVLARSIATSPAFLRIEALHEKYMTSALPTNTQFFLWFDCFILREVCCGRAALPQNKISLLRAGPGALYCIVYLEGVHWSQSTIVCVALVALAS